MIVVLDTNVWISGILWSGPPREIIELAEQDIFAVASSEVLLRELFGVLGREKFQHPLQKAAIELDTIRESVSALVVLYSIIERVSIVSNDPPDNAVLECALASGAHHIVSGDDHLLSLKVFRDIPIVTPRQFLGRLRKE